MILNPDTLVLLEIGPLRLNATIAGTWLVMLLLADLPEIIAADLDQMIGLWQMEPEAILRGAGADGTPGHPVIFPADLREAFATLSRDQGARPILQAHAARLHTIALPGHHALTDLDTPEAWATWTQSRALSDR